MGAASYNLGSSYAAEADSNPCCSHDVGGLVRSLLHAPRSRRRSIAAATLGALALIGSVLVVTPAQALSDTGTGGVFVPATGRILDTKNNVGGYNTPMPAKTWRTVTVAGKAGVPDDGTVGAVSVVATVADISAQGQLFGRPNADEPTTMMGIYGGENKQNTSFSAVLAVNSDGTIQVQAETASRLILDVQGYYTASDDGTAPGGFVPSNGKRIVDTRSGLGAAKATVASGKSIDVQVTGTADVPTGASGVIVNLIAVNTTDSVGYLTPYATGSARPANSFNYAGGAGGVATSMQAQVQLSASGKITVYNANSTTNIVVDVQGYFTAAGQGGAVFTPGAGRAYDTRTGSRTPLAKNETRSIQIAGVAGVPVMGSGITAVVLTLTALKSTAGSGNATVWADGTTKPNTTAINFDETTIRTNTITVPLGANGKISLNNVADVTNYVIDVQGWYTALAAPTVSCSAPFSAGSWVDDATTADGALATATCTVTAPAASASGDQMEFDVNGAEEDTVDLLPDGPTTTTVSFDAVPGQNVLEAYVVAASGDEGPHATSAFGTGNWAAADLAPLVDDGGTTFNNIVLGANPANGDGLPGDVNFKFWLHDDAAAVDVVSTDWQPGLLPVDETMLLPGHAYSWNMEIRGTSRWSDVVTRTSPTWRFTTMTEDAEAAYDPSVDDDDSVTTSKPTSDSIIEQATPAGAEQYIEDQDSSSGQMSTRGLRYGPCVLNASGTWFRKSSGYNNIGAKPSTVCSKRVAQIDMTSHPVRLTYALGFIPTGVKEYWPAVTHKAYNTSKFTDKNLGFPCRDFRGSASWYVTTLGHVRTYNNLNYYVWNHSSTTRLGCKA